MNLGMGLGLRSLLIWQLRHKAIKLESLLAFLGKLKQTKGIL